MEKCHITCMSALFIISIQSNTFLGLVGIIRTKNGLLFLFMIKNKSCLWSQGYKVRESNEM